MMKPAVIMTIGEMEVEATVDSQWNVYTRCRYQHPDDDDDAEAEWEPTPYVLGDWDDVLYNVVRDYADPSGGDDVDELRRTATWRRYDEGSDASVTGRA